LVPTEELWLDYFRSCLVVPLSVRPQVKPRHQKALHLIWKYQTGFYRAEMTLATVLVYSSIPFVLVTLYFGTRNGFYNTDAYDGDGTAHKVLK
jgi:hypothetical protein